MSEAAHKPNLWQRTKERWGVTGWGVVLILLSFALAGSTVLKISRPIMRFILPPDAPKWLWWIVRIVVIVPIYELLLWGYSTLLGQRKFFSAHKKKVFSRFKRRSPKETLAQPAADDGS